MPAKQFVVDPRLLADLIAGQSTRASRAVRLLTNHTADELVVPAIADIALRPLAPDGRKTLEDTYARWRISVVGQISADVMHEAYRAWSAYRADHAGETSENKRIFPILYAGAFALRRDGILTAEGDFFRTFFKDIKTIES